MGSSVLLYGHRAGTEQTKTTVKIQRSVQFNFNFTSGKIDSREKNRGKTPSAGQKKNRLQFGAKGIPEI
jgi:hypothetical protein